MKPYIYGKRNKIHILNIRETLRGILTAQKFLEKIAGNGGEFLFIGTKRQAKDFVQTEAERCGAHYVHERWIGGLLTNHHTIRSRLARLEEIELSVSDGSIAAYTKRTQSGLLREKAKIEKSLWGVRKMFRIPDAVIVVDALRERTAIAEANRVKIPVICLLDTDGNPDLIDIVVPGNDDSTRAIRLVMHSCANAILAGKKNLEDRIVREAAERAALEAAEKARAEALERAKAEAEEKAKAEAEAQAAAPASAESAPEAPPPASAAAPQE